MKRHEDKAYLLEQIKSKNYLQIAKECKVGKTTIYRKLKKFELTKPTKKWTKKEIQILKENYSENLLINKLFPNRTRKSIYRKAFRLRLKRNTRKRQYSINKNFFKTWNSKSTYVLGWMYSDGNVSVDRGNFSLHLNMKDAGILEKIKRALQSNQVIYKYKKSVALKVHSCNLVRDLVELGCFPRKSKKIRFPFKMPKKYESHFVRGYFDGDGSIHFNSPNVIKISLVGNHKFITDLRSKIFSNVKIPPPKISTSNSIGSVWRIEYYGNNARKFCNWIYKNCGKLYLGRKRTRFKNHLKQREILYGAKTSHSC